MININSIIKEEFGLTTEEFLKEYVIENVVPGLCKNCSKITDAIEPDQTQGFCEFCGKNEVESLINFILF